MARFGGSVCAAWVLACGCKATLGDGPSGDGGAAGGDALIGIDAPTADAAPTIDAALGAWGTPAPIATAATALGEDDPVLSSDGLELIFALDNSAAGTGKDLYRMTRASTADPFGSPAPLTALNTAGTDESPRLSTDDLTLYWGRAGDIMTATRASRTAPFGAPASLGYPNTGAAEKWFDTCDGYYLVVRADAPHGTDLFEGQVGAPTTGPVAALNSDQAEISTLLARDCLHVYFASTRTVGGANPVRLYTAARPSVTGAWGAPVPVTDFGVSDDDEDLWLSPDGHIAVFASTRGGTGSKDLYMSTR